MCNLATPCVQFSHILCAIQSHPVCHTYCISHPLELSCPSHSEKTVFTPHQHVVHGKPLNTLYIAADYAHIPMFKTEAIWERDIETLETHPSQLCTSAIQYSEHSAADSSCHHADAALKSLFCIHNILEVYSTALGWQKAYCWGKAH